jgi:Catechol dioxygenase N terminus
VRFQNARHPLLPPKWPFRNEGDIAMRDFDEHNITDAVIDRFQNTPDPRLKKIMVSLVRHLHDFVRDVELTFDEWVYAIHYLTRTGHICSDVRQEFILLSDTFQTTGLSGRCSRPLPVIRGVPRICIL